MNIQKLIKELEADKQDRFYSFDRGEIPRPKNFSVEIGNAFATNIENFPENIKALVEHYPTEVAMENSYIVLRWSDMLNTYYANLMLNFDSYDDAYKVASDMYLKYIWDEDYEEDIEIDD